MTSLLTVGAIITNSHAFTTPTGAHFLPGAEFEVEIVGRSTRCRDTRTGVVVWIQGSALGSRFLTA